MPSTKTFGAPSIGGVPVKTPGSTLAVEAVKIQSDMNTASTTTEVQPAAREWSINDGKITIENLIQYIQIYARDPKRTNHEADCAILTIGKLKGALEKLEI
jgi:hypothetical protein